jgi:hypothetical protein
LGSRRGQVKQLGIYGLAIHSGGTVPANVGRRRLALAARTRQPLGQRLQPDRAPTLFHAVRILRPAGSEPALLIGLELRREELRPSLQRADAVFQHRRLPRRRLAPLDRPMQEPQAQTHEVGLADRVLHDQPRRLLAVLADEGRSRPPPGREDRAQACGVALVDGFHARVVALEQGPVRRELLANAQILRRQARSSRRRSSS